MQRGSAVGGVEIEIYIWHTRELGVPKSVVFPKAFWPAWASDDGQTISTLIQRVATTDLIFGSYSPRRPQDASLPILPRRCQHRPARINDPGRSIRRCRRGCCGCHRRNQGNLEEPRLPLLRCRWCLRGNLAWHHMPY